tara:strand:+ start:391 stop:648 length:258 start_codon:yes stop_codon:yes gene_type:complete
LRERFLRNIFGAGVLLRMNLYQDNGIADETFEYWLKLAPKIWPTLDSKKKALQTMKTAKTSFITKKGFEARISALQQLIKEQENE